jgi:hypothetical protein
MSRPSTATRWSGCGRRRRRSSWCRCCGRTIVRAGHQPWYAVDAVQPVQDGTLVVRPLSGGRPPRLLADRGRAVRRPPPLGDLGDRGPPTRWTSRAGGQTPPAHRADRHLRLERQPLAQLRAGNGEEPFVQRGDRTNGSLGIGFQATHTGTTARGTSFTSTAPPAATCNHHAPNDRQLTPSFLT